MLLSFWLPLFLTLQGQVGAGLEKSTWQGPDQPVYVIAQNHLAEGFGPEGETLKFGDLIAIEIFNPSGRSAEKNALRRVGERIALFTGGEKHGRVKIEKILPLQCHSSAALVSTDAASPWPKDGMALATNSRSIRAHASNQRPADALERWQVRNLAMAEFRTHGVPAELAGSITVDHLIVTSIDGSQDLYFFGFLFIEYQKAGHTVFLIGKLGSSGATTELARYLLVEDLADRKDSENIRFVDQLDLDGDGTDEIVVEVRGFERERFEIYKRRNASWSVVHIGGQGGC